MLVCPRERGEKPYPGGDRDGLKRAFPDGMPIREEERVLQWMVAAARRLGGSVRIGENGTVLTPDVDSAIDLTVLSDSWLEPAEALAVVQSVLPRARLSEATGTWTGPAARASVATPAVVPAGSPRPADAGCPRPSSSYGVDDEAERQRLMDEASAYDELMIAVPPVPEAYGVLVDLGHDGTLSVEAGVETALPPLMRDLPWTARRRRRLPRALGAAVHRGARGRAAVVRAPRRPVPRGPAGAGRRARGARRDRRRDRRRGGLSGGPRGRLTPVRPDR